MRNLTALFVIVLFVFIYLGQELSEWENLSVCLFVYVLLDFLNNLGKKVVIMDLTIIMAALTCLLMPVIFYHVYTRSNYLARLWLKYMPIQSDDYFSFVFPAVVAMIIGLKIPVGKKTEMDKNPRLYMDNAKKYLSKNPKMGMILISVGVVCGLLNFLAPDNLKQVFYFTAHLTHVGVFYVIYSPSKRKKLIVAGVLALVVGQCILTGMFGELVFVLACSLVLLLLGSKISFTKKLLFAVAGIFLIVMIQAVKKEYRQKTWGQENGADAFYFGELISDKITNPSMLLDPNQLFYTSVRMNQGWLVAMTIRNVPQKFSFANGETIWQSIAAAIVPRFLWPDKPETGGKANLKRFWGFDLVGWSTNIGILGEAYANFDRVGGIIYMFFYGLFFNLIISRILRLSEKTPTLVLWIPFLFFTAIAVETDLLSTMGALIKGIIFTWLVYKIFRLAFHIEL